MIPSQFKEQSPQSSGQFADLGFEVLPSVLPGPRCDILAKELSFLHEREQEGTKTRRGGLRNLLQASPSVADLARSTEIEAIVRSRLKENVFPIRALFFDKTPAANWFVPWHQDIVIAVAERQDVPGFENWSLKQDVVHVEAPRDLLEQLVTLRLHLDHCDGDNGALKVIPGSHLHGKLRSSQIAEHTKAQGAFVCEVAKGGAVLMRPLLIHCSSAAKRPSHRRVLDIQYATHGLPNGLNFQQ